MSSRILVVIACAATIALATHARDAAAEPTADDAAADALFDEAVALRNAGDRAGACAKFRRSYKLAAARGTLLNIAECYEAEGKIASAWTTYRTLADHAEAAGDRDRLAIARTKRADLEPRLAYLTIVIAAEPEGITVQRDRTMLPSDVLDAPVPIDAGTHTITVSAPGHHPWTTSLDVTDGARHRVDVPALQPLPPPPPAPSVVPAVVPPSAPATRRLRHPRAKLGMYALGAGAASAVIGLGFGGAAWRAKADADGECDPYLACTTFGRDRLEDARGHATRANAFVGLGLTLAVTGVVLWRTAPEGPEVTVTPMGSPDMVGVAVGGRL